MPGEGGEQAVLTEAQLRRAGKAAKDIVDLIGCLLRLCRDHRAELAAEDRRRGTTTLYFRAYQRATAVVAEQEMSSRSVADLATELFDVILEPPLEQLQPVSVAKVACDALADVAHGLAQAVFFAQTEVVPAEGDCLPLPMPNRRKQLEATPAPGQTPDGRGPVMPMDPVRRITPLSKVQGFTLWDAVPEYEVTLRLSEGADVDHALGKGLPTIATAHPNTSWHELTVPAEGLDLEEGTWFGARPVDPPRQLALVEKLLAKAAAGGAHLVCFPELATPVIDGEVMGPDVRATLQVGPRLVHVGSRHVGTTGDRAGHHNEAAIYLDGERLLVHRKFMPYTVRGSAVGAPEEAAGQKLREGIECVHPIPLTIAFGKSWRLATIICADAWDEDAVRLLAKAGVNLLAVAALSTAPGDFPGSLQPIVSLGQGFVVVANGPNDVDPEVDPADRLAHCSVRRPWPREAWQQAWITSPSVVIVRPLGPPEVHPLGEDS